MRQIRKATLIPAILALSALGACTESDGESYESADGEYAEASVESSADMAAEQADDRAGTSRPGVIPELGDMPISMPKMAYVFDYGFRLEGDDIADLQQKHADMCEAQGPYSCQIIAMNHSGETGEYASGELRMAVAAPKARDFGKQLTTSAETAGGEQVSSSLQGEDLSKAIVDTEARLRARTVLRDRLLETLRTRRGSVSELVEAERSVARVNEEIDQARSWLEEMRGRVSFSRMNIRYESGSPAAGAFISPISAALGSVGTILGGIFAFLIVAGTILIPLALVVWGLMRLRKKFDAMQSAAAAEA